ncbi:hypothetical protein WN51_02127 [Melipona quadrifasciata]|uniref:Uncharacterized protein n=1 Tax=Melipona quadrifasciata TaxID=166423 RepID=A0A0M8ZVY7_9HYME|nr:hypothetical protein WN51_02127 [Melipona quadrifasciata]
MTIGMTCVTAIHSWLQIVKQNIGKSITKNLTQRLLSTILQSSVSDLKIQNLNHKLHAHLKKTKKLVPKANHIKQTLMREHCSVVTFDIQWSTVRYTLCPKFLNKRYSYGLSRVTCLTSSLLSVTVLKNEITRGLTERPNRPTGMAMINELVESEFSTWRKSKKRPLTWSKQAYNERSMKEENSKVKFSFKEMQKITHSRIVTPENQISSHVGNHGFATNRDLASGTDLWNLTFITIDTGLQRYSSARAKMILMFFMDNTTPFLFEVYATPPHESRDPNQPIANFRCISVAPEEARFSEFTSTKVTFSDKTQQEGNDVHVSRLKLQTKLHFLTIVAFIKPESCINIRSLIVINYWMAELISKNLFNSRHVTRNRGKVGFRIFIYHLGSFIFEGIELDSGLYVALEIQGRDHGYVLWE